jgi:predicted DsbA family dithiol-disulfide isomerase
MTEFKLARSTGRRKLLVLAGLAVGSFAAFRGAWWVLDQQAGELRFAPVDDPPGFRLLSLIGASSGALDPLAGIGDGGANAAPLTSLSDAELCQDLFGAARFEPGVVPIAFFSDFNCPYCNRVAEDLVALEAEGAGKVHLSRHEWPILGDGSQVSARAAIAAARQGARNEFSRRLQGSVFVPTEAFLRELALSSSIDPDRLLADMASDEITSELHTSTALVRRFGFPGTPALVVGRTIVFGAIRTATLKSLIEVEWVEGPPPACS